MGGLDAAARPSQADVGATEDGAVHTRPAALDVPVSEGAAVVDVAVLAPAPGPYSYAVSADLLPLLRPGSRVLVPLAGRPQVEGVVLRVGAAGARAASLDAMEAGRTLKPIDQILSGPPVPAELLGLVDFISDYYLAPQGEALRLVLPPHEQVTVRERVALTEAGAALARQVGAALLPMQLSERPAAEQQVLGSLAELLQRGGGRRKNVSVDALTKALGTGGLPAAQTQKALRGLRDAMLVRIDQTVAASVAARPETWATALPDGLDGTVLRQLERSEARASLWRHLVRFGPLPLAELRTLSPRASVIVKQLQRLGAVQLDERTPTEPRRGDSAAREIPTDRAIPQLTQEQARALSPMLAALGAGYHGFLLHGVTGSGKTELYLRLIAAALQAGKSAIVLVPEIALTPQLSARFVARFGPQVAVLHSGLEATERARAWRRILNSQAGGAVDGEVRIVLGPRSALFAPLANLGVVIVDEEHDSSFKQEEGARYSGRDVALVRAQRAGAVAVLGSATPSLETLALARRGKLSLLQMHARATGMPLPRVEVIDLKQHILPEDQALFSAPLLAAISETLGAGEQALLFLNRRGFSTFLLCKSCGHRVECRNCAVTLTWHKARGRLMCHYCGHSEPLMQTCPVCASPSIAQLGAGTEKLQEQLQERFPTARVARLDRDTSGDLDRVLSAMHRREIDLLIGTQMLAKGHDFPGVTLVGVLLADTGMGLPDFRASERTFQLLAQVAGRAGRQERPGRVLIQTYNPEHVAVVCAARHDYAAFAEQELQARTLLGYSPAQRVGLLRIDGRDPGQVRAGAERLATQLRIDLRRRDAGAPSVDVLGPAEAPLSRLKGRSRWQILLRSPSSQALRALLRVGLSVRLGSSLRITADVDPSSTL